ncbi:VOC family protein [Rhodococcus sp. GXMU-t2271]|uniref:Catechol 1,2-dioxygenase n=1 Tax=Rhodococcus rhodochrous KG-21 TaxID=1441923 RepID=A0A0M8PPN5_RHORH|nr:VOC family protein [Rhodococcus rhodochrous]KOS56509.1 catechol 1,2-dioxygenase [Rhodococcus rhodochrous KG-21]
MTDTTARFDIAHLARAELFTPRPQETLDFFTKFLGMYVTHREGQSVYLRGYEDPYQWSLKVTEAPEPGMGHAALRASSSEALERRVASLKQGNVEGKWSEDQFGYGKTFEFQSPDGHNLQLLWEVEKYVAPKELESKILSRPSKKPLQGIPVKRIDHLNLMSSDVTAVKDSFERHLGFRTTERVVDGGVEIGAWMSSNLLGHEVACMRDMTGGHGKLHHLAFYYGTGQHLADAVEMFRDYDIRIEAGPDKHGITQGQFLYVFEPGGNRIELFGEAGYLHLDPDAETKTWQMADIDTGLAVGGAKLPWETYFTYGTPNPLALDQHIEKFSHFGPGAPVEDPEVIAAEQAIPDDIDHSRAVSGSPV